MSTMSLSRRQRRQMKRLGEEADRAVEGDRRYFDRWPHRTYRIRLISSAERKQLEIFQGHPIRPTPDQAVFTVMKQLAPGVRMRATVIGPHESIGEELTDAEVCRIYEGYADWSAPIEVVRPLVWLLSLEDGRDGKAPEARGDRREATSGGRSDFTGP
ncbi:hypothetical protein MKK65_08185, partial [Methylobacterium sp. J-001]|uniref:hypothetical protein n=1 Tax=Methylobacterium sp. J-001 TaxID=2836609 RepID=UPI001FB8BB36